MIDLSTETIISLQEAAKRLPGRQGKRLHISAVYRWISDGVRSVKLEAIQIGGKQCTSVEALQRFAAACTRAANGEQQPTPRPKAERDRAAQRAGRELAALGVA